MREVRLAASHRRVGRPATVAWAGHAPTGEQATRQPGSRPRANRGAGHAPTGEQATRQPGSRPPARDGPTIYAHPAPGTHRPYYIVGPSLAGGLGRGSGWPGTWERVAWDVGAGGGIWIQDNNRKAYLC